MSDRPEEQEAVYTTIVGGRPPGCGTKVGEVPRGIEILVKKAAVDPEFKRRLLSDRAEAADDIELKLDPAETMMLKAIPHSQLESIIDQTSVPEQQKPAFLGTMAASMLLALGIGLAGCSEAPPAPTGSRPDRSPEKTQRTREFSKGIQPDRPQKYKSDKSEEKK